MSALDNCRTYRFNDDGLSESVGGSAATKRKFKTVLSCNRRKRTVLKGLKMAIIHRYIELALFLILNIFLALPGLLFALAPINTILFISLIISVSYIIYFKFTVFDFLYRRKKLPYIRKFLSKLQTDDKSLFLITAAAIALDAVLCILIPYLPSFEWLKPSDYSILDMFLGLSFSGLSFSYIGFWIIKLFKKFKNRFWLKNHLAKFKNVIGYKLFSPLIFSFCILIVEAIFWHFYVENDETFLILALPIFFVSTLIQLVIDIIISVMIGTINKSGVLTITRIFRETEIFITLFGYTLFLFFTEFYGCMAD